MTLSMGLRHATRRFAALALALLLAVSCPALAQRIALTFDDGLNPTEQDRAAEWNAAILRALSDAKVKSMIFPAGRRVDSPEGLGLVRDWGLAGHGIANHTYAHMNLNAQRTGADAFITDVEKAQALLEDLPNWTARLRFPYLKEGDTAAKRDALRAWMKHNGYAPGALTIDTSDWYYNKRYLAWREANPDGDPKILRQAYLDHLWSRAQYYDGLSNQLLGRSPRHVLLLHTNAINADFLPDVIAMFRSKGWKVISPERAYRDRLFEMVPDVLPAGESIVWALARQRGLEPLRYPAEDATYEEPILDELGL